MMTKNQRLTFILLGGAFILLIPFTAMQFSQEVQWTMFDFMVAGTLLFGTGLTCELVLRTVKQKKHRIVICTFILLALLIIWMELAVGIFGTPLAGT